MPVKRGDIVRVEANHTYVPVTGVGSIMGLLSGGSLGVIPISACFEARLELTPSNQSGMTQGAGC
jgi:hypothetical protein